MIPKTSHPARLAENLALFQFTLTESQMDTLRGLNRNHRYNDPGVFCESAFNTFCPIFD